MGCFWRNLIQTPYFCAIIYTYRTLEIRTSKDRIYFSNRYWTHNKQ